VNLVSGGDCCSFPFLLANKTQFLINVVYTENITEYIILPVCHNSDTTKSHFVEESRAAKCFTNHRGRLLKICWIFSCDQIHNTNFYKSGHTVALHMANLDVRRSFPWLDLMQPILRKVLSPAYMLIWFFLCCKTLRLQWVFEAWVRPRCLVKLPMARFDVTNLY